MSEISKTDGVRINLIAPDKIRRNLKLIALHMGLTANDLGKKILNEGVQKYAKQEGVELI